MDEQTDGEFWFEEEILPPEPSLSGVVDGLKGLAPRDLSDALGHESLAALPQGEGRDAAIEQYAREDLRGRVRVNWPRARPAHPAGAAGAPWLVRLGVEYVLSPALERAKYRYKRAWCRVALAADGAGAPRVLDVYPVRLYEGGARTVNVRVEPSLKLSAVEAGLGSVSSDVPVGVVAPATLGFLGPDDRAPYWQMSEQQRAIHGHYDFWFLLDLPPGGDPAAVRLAVLGEGDLRFHMVNVPLGPVRRRADERRWLSLAEIAARTGR